MSSIIFIIVFNIIQLLIDNKTVKHNNIIHNLSKIRYAARAENKACSQFIYFCENCEACHCHLILCSYWSINRLQSYMGQSKFCILKALMASSENKPINASLRSLSRMRNFFSYKYLVTNVL